MITKRHVAVLSGLSRVGKSTIMFQIIDEAIRQGVRGVNLNRMLLYGL